MTKSIQVIGKDVNYIGVRHYLSRAYGMEGQECVTVSIDGKKYRHSACNDDGICNGIVEWFNEEIQNNEAASQILERVLNADQNFTGANIIRKNEDGTYTIRNFGQNAVEQLLRQFGIKLRHEKSSSRSDSYIVGYRVSNEGVDSETLEPIKAD